ncbi:uncharacterized protein At3g60930, chloroplastic-like [Eutrema salsugineum]|uniref:uncharacterized protein At3g60930, chloroplastic-like n=1 Tax=Eutrema salsugineum TaxID=72664 RepID=UPI000CED5AD7|nr:uncharacterized protein At3g60930, chloroplastic-like [Eutrema salsugineum]
MSNHSNNSLDSLFNYGPSRVDTEARGVTGSSEAFISPSFSNRSSKSNEASNRSNPSGARSPDDEPSVSTNHPQGPALDEDVNHAAVKAEEEAFPFDLFEAKRELERLMASPGASSSGRGKRVKRQKPDPPGSTLSSPDSLKPLRCRFGISEAVEFVLPEKNDRADKPPENHFTLYEAFFELCILWFLIPGIILEYLWKHGISIGQIMPRGLRHMIGILVRSFECGLDIELNHLLNLLEIRKSPKGDRFYISNKYNRRIIGGFPSKDQFWTERFFYVLVNEASVGEDYVQKTKTTWGPLVRNILPPIPDDLFAIRDSLAAQRVNWKKHFSFERVEKARAILAGVPVSSSSSNSSLDTREKMVIITLRDKKRHEEEEDARQAAEAAQTETEAVPQTDPPSREGEGTVQAAEANVAEATEKEAAPEVEPGEIIPEAPKDDSAARSKTLSIGYSGSSEVIEAPDFVVAAINELIAEYEADVSKVERRLDEARNETAAAKGKLDKAMTRVSRLEKGKIVLRADVDKVSSSVIHLEEVRRAKSTEVALLKRRIEAKDALFNTKVKRAKKEARRELTAKFQERLAKVEEGLAKLEKAKTDENVLGQIKGNLAMIADLRKQDAPTLDDEEAKLKSWESEYADDEAYERIASEIRGELVFSPVSPGSVDTSLGNEPLEETAANLGVVDPTGSNAGTPALSNILVERGTQSAA